MSRDARLASTPNVWPPSGGTAGGPTPSVPPRRAASPAARPTRATSRPRRSTDRHAVVRALLAIATGLAVFTLLQVAFELWDQPLEYVPTDPTVVDREER